MTVVRGAAADTVLVGSAVYTVDAARSWAEAVAIRDGRIVAVGPDDEVRSMVGPHTSVIALAGRMVVPGFQDSHVHVLSGGLSRLRCDLSEEHTLAGYLDRIERYATAHPELSWILGEGWSMDIFPGGTPGRDLLDRIVPDRPVFLGNRDNHGVWVNSRALALAGIDRHTPDPPDGRIERGADGEPQGTLHEGAMGLISRLVPPPSSAELRAGLLEGQRYLHRLGITGWQDAIVGRYATMPDNFDTYRELAASGELTGRVVGALWWERGAGLGQLEGLRERRAVASSGRFRATSVKIMVDGVCENFTAALSEPYLDLSGQPTGNLGLTFFDPAALVEEAAAIDLAGFQMHFHAIGDRAVGLALDAVERARSCNGASDHRHHIAHLQLVRPQDRPRFRALGVAVNAQPFWSMLDRQMKDLTLPFLGSERARWQYPWASLRRHGTMLTIGSDWPVSSPDPLWLMHVMVNRQAPAAFAAAVGLPRQGAPFLPEERVDLATALAAATIGSAWVNHMEGETGSIEVGKLADLTVLDRDIFAEPRSSIGDARAALTMIDGRAVYADPQLVSW
ncbi:MAG: amidohydrolase [Candidatus Dormibacteria bacterium]